MLLYIDPGTGSMLFTVLIGVLGAAFYAVRMLFIKLRFKLGGGKADTALKSESFVIFSDDKRYWKVFEPICREMDKRGKEILYITASPDDPALKCEYKGLRVECIENKNKLFTRLNYLRADIVLSTTPGLDVYQWKRSKDVKYYVHIPHAAGGLTMYRMFGLDYYDAVLYSGDFQAEDIRALEKLRNLPAKELVEAGIPYMDEMAKAYESAEPIGEHERTVLLAPTWGPSALFAVSGGKIIEHLLNTGYHIIVRPHPQSFTSEKEMLDKLMAEYPESEQLEWNSDTDNFNVLHRADILVSDFSGVFYDFAFIHNKPIIYTDVNFNLDVYDAWWIQDRPLWLYSALPRIGCKLTPDNMSNIKELIDECLTDEYYAEGRQAAKNETWANIGRGAEIVTDYLINKQKELSDKEEK
ncbi:MAG: CDP-glycerol glycerophosphotransferase family protein [Clostridia bacterium]|nr:CDP-glycerol glycerophosphotransferase family protein [Clostridia bacterium]